MSDNVSNSADKAVAEKPEEVDRQRRGGSGSALCSAGRLATCCSATAEFFSPASCAPCLAGALGAAFD